MKRRKLTLRAESIRVLTDFSPARGGAFGTIEFSNCTFCHTRDPEFCASANTECVTVCPP